MNLRTFVLAATVILASASSLTAQTDSCLQRTVAVNLLTERGEPVSGLAAENLKAYMLPLDCPWCGECPWCGNKPPRPGNVGFVRILSVSESREAPRVLIALDASSDMIESRAYWRFEIEAARGLIRALPTETFVGLISFSAKVEISMTPTRDRSGIERALTTLAATKPKGKTALWDSLAAAVLTNFDDPQSGDAIYVISDGGDNFSKMKVYELEDLIAKKRLRLFALSIEPPDDAERRARTLGLTGLALSSGGSRLFVPRGMGGLLDRSGTLDAQRVVGAYAQQFVSVHQAEWSFVLASQYHQVASFKNVQIELAKEIKEPEQWYLDLQGLKENWWLSYPRLLAACETTAAANPNAKN